MPIPFATRRKPAGVNTDSFADVVGVEDYVNIKGRIIKRTAVNSAGISDTRGTTYISEETKAVIVE